MHYGGGGLNGSVVSGLTTRYPAPPNAPVPLARGYVTFGSDSGHSGSDGTFALNDEALRNFGHEQLKKTHDVALGIIELRYGKKPERLYFAGNSQGGREALAVVQRYPTDYDGVFASEFVIDFTALSLHQNRILTLLAEGGWMNSAKIALLAKSTLAACDMLDGLADGIISNYMACHHDPAVLRCPGGKDTGDECLSDAQIDAVKAVRYPSEVGFELANGITSCAGYGAGGAEDLPRSWDRAIMGSTPPAKPQPIGMYLNPGVGAAPFYGHTFTRWFVARDPTFDTYHFDAGKYRKRILELSELLDSTNPDLSAFYARGGKLILKQNTADYVQSARTGMNYYKAVVAKLGQDKTDQFVRFYVTPGASHMGDYVPDSIDLVPLIEKWVENGQAPPESLIQEELDPKTFQVLRSRPLCRYPDFPKYNGSGDPNAASSFTCSAP